MTNSESISVRCFDKKNIRLNQEIGYGSFGKVYVGSIVNTNLPQVAIKVFFKEIKNRGTIVLADKEKAFEELLKVAVIDHENIVKLYGMVDEDMPWLVFEYMKDGNLLDYVRRSGYIKEKTLMQFCRDICNGMVFLHNNNILHKDLAARNILLHNKTAKIADLGLSSFLTNDDEGVYTLNGKLFPFRHAAVECIVEQLFTFESDVWSFGILMYEIFSGGCTPYGKENKEAEVRRFIVDHITPVHIREPYCSTKIYSVMNTILNPVIQDRPPFSVILATFETLLNVQPSQQSNNENISDALTAFHKIKSNGLSSSINNLHFSSSSPSLLGTGAESVLGASKTNGLLTVGYTPQSSSTSDILDDLDPEEPSQTEDIPWLQVNEVRRNDEKLVRVSANKNANKLALLSPFDLQQGRRHSADLIQRIPLVQEPLYPTEYLSSSSSMRYLDDNGDSQSQANSGSQHGGMNKQLLEGFVQNRFAKRKL